jgi:hypothetical protein
MAFGALSCGVDGLAAVEARPGRVSGGGWFLALTAGKRFEANNAILLTGSADSLALV